MNNEWACADISYRSSDVQGLASLRLASGADCPLIALSFMNSFRFHFTSRAFTSTWLIRLCTSVSAWVANQVSSERYQSFSPPVDDSSAAKLKIARGQTVRSIDTKANMLELYQILILFPSHTAGHIMLLWCKLCAHISMWVGDGEEIEVQRYCLNSWANEMCVVRRCRNGKLSWENQNICMRSAGGGAGWSVWSQFNW